MFARLREWAVWWLIIVIAAFIVVLPLDCMWWLGIVLFGLFHRQIAAALARVEASRAEG